MASALSHPTLAPQPQPSTPTPAQPTTPAPAAAADSCTRPPAVYFGDRIAMKVWFWGAAILACLLLVKELAAVLLPR
jgi:hypothetical protein